MLICEIETNLLKLKFFFLIKMLFSVVKFFVIFVVVTRFGSCELRNSSLKIESDDNNNYENGLWSSILEDWTLRLVLK